MKWANASGESRMTTTPRGAGAASSPAIATQRPVKATRRAVIAPISLTALDNEARCALGADL